MGNNIISLWIQITRQSLSLLGIVPLRSSVCYGLALSLFADSEPAWPPELNNWCGIGSPGRSSTVLLYNVLLCLITGSLSDDIHSNRKYLFFPLPTAIEKLRNFHINLYYDTINFALDPHPPLPQALLTSQAIQPQANIIAEVEEVHYQYLLL